MNIYELKELIDFYLEVCEENDLEPELKLVTQKSWPLRAKLTGSAINGTALVLGVETTFGYGKTADSPAFVANAAAAWYGPNDNTYEQELGYYNV